MNEEKRDLRKEKLKKRCRVCKGKKAIIRKYNLYVCRRCFKDIAVKIGFKKFD